MRHIWTVLCDRARIDSQTNNISLDVLESLQATVAGESGVLGVVVVPNCKLVSLWWRDDATAAEPFDVTVSVRSPDGQEIARTRADVTAEADQQRFRTIFELPGLPYLESGIYQYRVSLGSEEVASIPLEMAITRASVAASPPVSEPT